MSIFREIPPTAGLPLAWSNFRRLFTTDNKENFLEDDFKKFLNVDFARITYSGTAAFYLILESLKKISDKKTVIIPSYICPLVPLAIKRAGLRVEVCDINRNNFDFDLNNLEELCRNSDDTLAILAVHLAGIPVDFDAIKNMARRYNIYTIEDCAQSLGAVYKGKKAGTLGDFSFFSLCRGKGLTTYEGGVIITNKKEYAPIIADTIQKFVKDDFLSESLLVSLLIGYWIFYRPLLFWFVFKLPQLFWNWRGDKIRAAMEYFDAGFPIHKMSATRQLIGHGQFPRVEAEIEKQRQKASYYMERLKKIKGIMLVEELTDSRATYPFMTLIFDVPEKKEHVLRMFKRTGLGASIVYALAIADYGYLKHVVPDRNCSNARYVSERAITLSTSPFLKDKDLEAIVKIIEG